MQDIARAEGDMPKVNAHATWVDIPGTHPDFFRRILLAARMLAVVVLTAVCASSTDAAEGSTLAVYNPMSRRQAERLIAHGQAVVLRADDEIVGLAVGVMNGERTSIFRWTGSRFESVDQALRPFTEQSVAEHEDEYLAKTRPYVPQRGNDGYAVAVPRIQGDDVELAAMTALHFRADRPEADWSGPDLFAGSPRPCRGSDCAVMPATLIRAYESGNAVLFESARAHSFHEIDGRRVVGALFFTADSSGRFLRHEVRDDLAAFYVVKGLPWVNIAFLADADTQAQVARALSPNLSTRDHAAPQPEAQHAGEPQVAAVETAASTAPVAAPHVPNSGSANSLWSRVAAGKWWIVAVAVILVVIKLPSIVRRRTRAAELRQERARADDLDGMLRDASAKQREAKREFDRMQQIVDEHLRKNS